MHAMPRKISATVQTKVPRGVSTRRAARLPKISVGGTAPRWSEVSFQFEEAADIAGVDFQAGEPALDGSWLALAVNFARHGAIEGKKWQIWPREAYVRIIRATNNPVYVGTFRPYLTEYI